MEFRKFNDHYVVRIEKDEEIVNGIKELCVKEDIKLGSISGIGASNFIEIGLFNVNTKEYKTEVFKGMFEITSLTGNITRKDDEPYIHLHVNFSDETNTVRGGHFVKGYVSAACEVIVSKIDGAVGREFNEEIGLNLLKF
ncbi:MAG TPA: DUF296 domain-containing protein [Spirochaetota bacterium]|nr:DUF296 domain-containing protein [Spirochaetota bacterium]HPJ35744.1 DUF296 domain-containing protein [Spirochaetota bacterium]